MLFYVVAIIKCDASFMCSDVTVEPSASVAISAIQVFIVFCLTLKNTLFDFLFKFSRELLIGERAFRRQLRRKQEREKAARKEKKNLQGIDKIILSSLSDKT